eukprot:4976860-Ditylum_brightwellii.AAC.1
MERVCREEEHDHQDGSSVNLSDLEDGGGNDEYGDTASDGEDATGIEDKMDVPPSLHREIMSMKKERMQGNIKESRRNIPGRVKFGFIK